MSDDSTDEPAFVDRIAIVKPPNPTIPTIPIRPIRPIWPLFRCFRMPVRHTTVYVVRHCDVGPGSNPSLSAAGQQRADLLGRMLTEEPLDAVFVTQFPRTQQTGAPAAATAGLSATQYNASDTQVPVDAVLNNHIGGRVLIVGHSNTVDDICSRLGVNGVAELDHHQFDRMFAVHRFANVPFLERLRYGAET